MQILKEPTLLYNDECGVCRHIASWVISSENGNDNIIVRPIGDDPEALKVLNPDLNIWDAYATIHLLMPDGTMKVGGEAVAEVLRNLPSTQWISKSFAISIAGFRPFQAILDLGYFVLSRVRPLFGCESCGVPNILVKSLAKVAAWLKAVLFRGQHPHASPHFTSYAAKGRRANPKVM